MFSTDFPIGSKDDVPFHGTVFDYSGADWYDFMTISEILCEKICLIWMLQLLLLNFVSGFRFKLVRISLIESIMLSLIHPYGFRLLVLLLFFIEITPFA